MPLDHSPDELPAWIAEATLRAVEQAARHARACGRDSAAAAREAVWMRHPALPATMVADAVSIVLRRLAL